MLRAADTVGVFQVESRAQMATLPRMKPERFYDLVVEVAIIRPGPIVGKMLNPYLERRNGRARVTYPHPSLEPILKRTLGIPLFQEQLIRMAMVAAGFTGGQADELRRAMGFKRSHERMNAIEKDLRAGMTKNGITGAAQEEIVQGIKSFALYGFPESHAASFALIAYASAYLKAHHPAAFLCALLNNYPLGFYHPSTLVSDAVRHGVIVRAIDVTRSGWLADLEDGGRAVRLGLRSVSGLHEELGRKIEEARRVAPFVSLADFASRSGTDMDAGALSRLAEIGALAELGGERRAALWQVEALGRSGPLFSSTSGTLGGFPNPPATGSGEQSSPPPTRSNPFEESPLPEMSAEEELAADYAGTNLTIGQHPVAFARAALDRQGVTRAADLAFRLGRACPSVSEYVELRCRSAFSFLDGASLPEDLAEAAARQEMDTLALVDRDGVYGAPRFAAAARRVGIRPLVGADVTLADGPPLLLLVENRTGYRNLCRLLTRAREGLGKADPPRATRELLAEHAAGLIALGGAAPRADLPALCAAFGRANVYLEVQRHLDAREAWNERAVAAQAAAMGVGLVATNDVRYATPRERLVHDVLTCAREKRTVDEIGRRLLPNGERWLKSPREIAALFADRPAAVRATRAIAERCQFSLADLGYTFPRYAVPDGETEQSYLEKLCEAGVGHRYAADDPLRPKVRAQLGARAGDHRAARPGRLLPPGLGHRAGRPAEEHHDPGARLGGELGGLLRPRHHRRRSGEDGAAVRALLVGGAGAERRQRGRPHARHRSRSAVGRGARADDPARLRQVRAARRRHDRQRDHLPPADGGARRRPRAGVLRGAARPHLQAPSRLDRR